NDSLKNESYILYSTQRDTASIYLSKLVDSIQLKLNDQLSYSDTIVLKRFRKKTISVQNTIQLTVGETIAPGKKIHISSQTPVTLNTALDSIILIEDSIKYNVKDKLLRADAFLYKLDLDLSSEKKYVLVLKD